jgi:GT2 family glycosyltransferase
MTTSPRIALIILNWNGLKDTLACLESTENIDYPNVETIIVDNGSTDGSSAVIRKRFPKITLIENTTNLGFAEGNNVGIRYALKHDASYIFLLNNDTVVDPQILNAFLQTFAEHPEAGILGAKIYLFDHKDTLDHLGGMWNSRSASFDLIGNRMIDTPDQFQHPQEIDYVCGAALIAKRSVWETVGLLEPKFFLIWEESDFCFRARRSDFKTLTCPQAKIRHKVSASFVGKPHSTYFWWRNRLFWIERNCSRAEKIKIWSLHLIPDIIHMLKIRALKSLQLQILRRFKPKEDHRERAQKLLKTKAALQGVKDYVFRRFGPGPAWLFKPPPK